MRGNHTEDVELSEIGAPSNRFPMVEASKYFLTKNHTVTARQELKKQLFLFLVSVSGAYLYVPPTLAYAKRINDSPAPWLISTCFPALAFLYLATDIFFKIIASQRVPADLQNDLRGPTKAQRWRENALIGTVSALASVPFTAVVFVFVPKWMPRWALFLTAAVVQIDNTILHFLPVLLVKSQAIYRLPFLPAEWIVKRVYKEYQDWNLTLEEKNQRAYQVQVAEDIGSLKKMMFLELELAKQCIINGSFSWDWWHLSFTIKVPEFLKNDNDFNPDLLLEYKRSPAITMPSQFLSQSKLRTLLVVAGAFFLLSSSTGYLATPIVQFAKLTHSYTTAAVISAPPVYCLSVLLLFFGATFLGQFYDYVTTWGGSISKIPMTVKFYPKMFAALMVVNAVMTPYSYAAAVELVYVNFTGAMWKPYLPFLVGAAKSGIGFGVIFALRQFFMLMMLKFARHFGNDDTRLLAQRVEQIEGYQNSIMQMRDGDLEAELAGKTPQERQSLGMSDEAYQKAINHRANLENRPAERPWWSIFSCCKGEDGTAEEKRGLLESRVLAV